MKKKYYGVVGVNGYGIFDDYEKVLAVRKYLKKFKVKRDSNLEKIKTWTEDMYYELQENLSNFAIEPIKNLNWVYYAKRNR